MFRSDTENSYYDTQFKHRMWLDQVADEDYPVVIDIRSDIQQDLCQLPRGRQLNVGIVVILNR